jgi:phosphopantetheinyl transferase (holo-ACP synthase)
MADGKFKAKELMFKVSSGEFFVDCGITDALAAADLLCTQQTVQKLVLTLTEENLEALKEALGKALDELKALGGKKV